MNCLSPLPYSTVSEGMRTVNEGLKIDYTVNEGEFLTYRDKRLWHATSIQDTLYTDDLTLVAESWGDLQNMVNAIAFLFLIGLLELSNSLNEVMSNAAVSSENLNTHWASPLNQK